MKKRYLRPISKSFLLFTGRNELITYSENNAGGPGWIGDDINQYHDFGDEEDTDWKRK